MLFKEESDALKKSAWPRCDQMATALAARGLPALPALEAAISSRTHHVRSACLRAIDSLDPERGKELAQKMVNDRAYEVRETAAKILGIDVPN